MLALLWNATFEFSHVPTIFKNTVFQPICLMISIFKFNSKLLIQNNELIMANNLITRWKCEIINNSDYLVSYGET